MNQDTVGGDYHPRDLKNALDNYLEGYKFTKRLTKRQKVIAWLIVSSDMDCRVTRFDAEWIGDHVLNTTISEIGRIDGIKVERGDTKRPTRFGKDTDCKEYWLAPDQAEKAQYLIEGFATFRAA